MIWKILLKRIVKNKIKLIISKKIDRLLIKIHLYRSYRLLKVDTLSNSPIEEETISYISSKIRQNKRDILIFSDFRHGIFNSRSLPVLRSAIPKKIFKVGDSQVASRWGNITEFKKFDLITPNEKEARFVLADQDSIVGKLVGNLIKKVIQNLMLKLGERGVFRKSSKKYNLFPLDFCRQSC